LTDKHPKELGIKIGTPGEVLWTKVKDEAAGLLKMSEENIIIQRAMLKLAEEKIAEEQKV